MPEEQESTQPSASAGPTALVLIHALAWAPFLLYMVIVVPKMKVFFADVAVRVPHLTMLVLEWSDFLVGLGPLWLVGLLVFLGVDFAVLHNLKLAGRTVLFWIWFGLVLLTPIASWLVSWFAVWLTANQILHELPG